MMRFSPGDRQTFPGFFEALCQGRTTVQIGDNLNMFDMTYIDNLVHAHLLAAEKLGTTVPRSVFDVRLGPVNATLGRRKLPTSVHRPDGKWLEGERPSADSIDPDVDVPLPASRNRFDQFFRGSQSVGGDDDGDSIPIAGQVFIVTNGEPVPFWSVPRFVWRMTNGYVAPYIFVLPRSLTLFLAPLWESGAKLCGISPEPFTSTNIIYVTAIRYHNIEKTRRLLGYEPIVGLEEGVRRTVEVGFWSPFPSGQRVFWLIVSVCDWKQWFKANKPDMLPK
jgi:sterol-4alpha-carboxylate 3-dehydrogenase (decarboxylating)